MAFQLKALQAALLGVLGTGLLAAAVPAVAQTTPERLERVEVTGSNIKRTDTEGVAPVEVITREDIVRSGRPNIAEVLRNLPSNTGGSFGESFSNSFAPGAAGISLRGLGQKATLVLLNGRRVVSYGFAQNLQDSFVDLNAIPTSAVERVEILKDGASAIYGSDAIAGVVNIILRKDYTGLEGTLSGGRSEGKNEYQVNLTGGFGDLSRDKFNVFGTIDAYKRDLIELQDTEFGHTRDLRQYNGGRNFTSLTGGGTWRQYNANGSATNTYRAISGCQGNVINGQQAAAAGLINLSPSLSPATLATNTAQAAATNTFCSYDFNNQFTALPETERIGFLGRANYQFTPTTLGYLEGAVNRVKTTQTFQSPFFAGTTGLQSTAAGLRPFPYNVTFAPGVAGNPFAADARFVGVLTNLGTRDNVIGSNTYRGLAGLQYSVGQFEFDSAVGYSKNIVNTQNINRITLSGTSAALGVGTGVQPPIPRSTFSTYNLDNPGLNSDAVNRSILIDFGRKATSSLAFADTRASTEIQQLRLPGGPVGVALGVEFRSEKLEDRPDPAATGGNILGQGITATDGSRRNYAFSVEFALPIFKQLEAQIAGRIDKYSDYGSSKTPKFGLKYTPTDAFAIRGNYGRGFRAPTLPEISPSVATFFQTVTDPEDGLARQISGVFAGNPTLKAETSVSSTAGVIFEPNKSFSASVDVYKIKWRNVVASRSFQSILDDSCPAGGPGCPSTAQIIRDPNNNNAVVTILSNYQNLAERRTSGVDFDLRYTFPTTAYGKFTARANVTYIHTFSEDGDECVGHNGCTNTIPRVKGAFTLDYDYGPLSLTGRMNYTHGVIQDLAATYQVQSTDQRFQTGRYPERTPTYKTYDLFGRYEVTKNVSVSASIVNVFNQLPPYDPGFSATYFYDFSLFDVRGRQYRANLTYKM